MPQLRVTLFGALDVRDAAGTGFDAVLAQPKRAALLAYLAATHGRGLRRRDSLLALFWPELSERRARDALNSALYFLRKSLGEGVIVGRGSDEIGLADEAVWCDLVAFDAALAAGDAAAALELVRGTLLDGLLIADAPEFDDWLSRERERVRAASRDGALRLSNGAQEGGDTGAAAQWARRALELAPDDEGVLRTLMRALERDGDVAGALRQYESFARYLGRALELEPSPQTTALAAELRERYRREETHEVAPEGRDDEGPMDQPASRGVAALDAPASAPAPAIGGAPADAPARESAVAERASSAAAAAKDAVSEGRGHAVRLMGGPGTAAGATAAAPPPVTRAPGESRRWWRIGSALAVLAAAVALAVPSLTRRLGGSPADAEPAAVGTTALAVFPFIYHGAEPQLFLGEGVARLLGTALDGAGALRVIDPRALLGAAGQLPPDGDTAAEERRWESLASRLRAQLYVSGEIDASGDSLDVRAALHDARRSAQGEGAVLARAQVRAGKDELFTVVDQLALQLMAALPSSPGERIGRVAARTTQSLPALRLYLAGEGEFRRGRFAEAIEAFRGAVAADTTFALAYYRLSNALTWSRVPLNDSPDSLAGLAVRYASHLPERDRTLFRAWRSYNRGDAVDAEQRYREVLSSRPDDVEANFYLGEVLFHWGPLFGRPTLEAREPFAKVLAFEPDNAGALSHLVRLAATANDTVQLRRYVAQLSRLNPDPAEVVEVRTLQAYATRDREAMRQFEDTLVRQSSRDARRLIWTVAAHTHDPAAIERLLARLAVPPSEPFARRLARIAHALQLVAMGRPTLADSLLAPNDVVTPMRSVEYRTALATLPFVTTPPERLRELERALRSTTPREHSVGPGQYSLPSEGIYPPRRLYLLGLIRLRLQDTAGVARYADTLQVTPWENNRNRLFSQGFARLLRAELLAHAGRPADALASLGLPGVEEDSNLTEITSYPKAHERYLRGELLRRLGRGEEAARWFGTFPDLQLSDLMYRPIAELRVGTLAEQRGAAGEAIEAYRRVLRHLRGAEPSFAPFAAEARAGLARLRAPDDAEEVDAPPRVP